MTDLQNPFSTEFVEYVIKEVARNPLPAYVTAAVVGIGGATVLLLARGFISRFVAKRVESVGRYGRIDRTLAADTLNAFLSFLPLLPVYWALKSLTFSASLTKLIDFIFLLVFTFAIVRLMANLAGFLVDAMLRGQGGRESAGGEAVMPIVRTLVWALGITFLLDNLGFQISTIVAGLGIMGVAVGLAGQAILSDFFSYLVIIMDKPFSIGDYLSFGGTSGTVEHIGLKTTRLRAVTGELIVVPNGDITKQTINNYYPVRSLQRSFSFGVAYETPLDKLRAIPQMVKDAAKMLPGVYIQRVHFTTFGDSSLVYEVLFSVHGRDFGPLRDAQQELNLGIMERFEQEGIIFAYPTQTLYMASALPVEEVTAEQTPAETAAPKGQPDGKNA